MKQTFPQNLSRKNFLKLVGFSGAAFAALYGGYLQLRELPNTQETRILMGTTVNLTLVGVRGSRARKVISHAMNTMETLESVLSRHRPDSQLSLLNQQGNLSHSHPALKDVVLKALEISSLTNGAFDITIKPLVDLYQQVYKDNQQLPDQRRIQQALSLVNYRQVTVENSRIHFGRPGMEITLDGIAKGYIVDQARHSLLDQGISRVLVGAGGDLFASGHRGHGNPWKIGIQHPRNTSRKELLGFFSVRSQAVATSGDYQQAFSDDLKAHHIIDPREGVSPLSLASATIVAPNTTLADALGTAVMVLGPGRGIKLIENLEGCQAYLVTKELENKTTTLFPPITLAR